MRVGLDNDKRAMLFGPCLLVAIIMSSLGATATTTDVIANRNITVTWTHAQLLSGGVNSCDNQTASSCNGGVSAAQQLLRELHDETSMYPRHCISYFPTLDRTSPFVQMHPLSWGVNTKFFRYFNVSRYIVYPSLFSEIPRDGFEEFFHPRLIAENGPMPILSNIRVLASDDWYNVVSRSVVLNKVGYIHCDSDFQPNSLRCGEVVASTSRFLRREGTAVVEAVIVLYSYTAELQPPSVILKQFVDEFTRRGFNPLNATKSGHVPYPDVLLYHSSSVEAFRDNETGIYVVGLATTERNLNAVTIHLHTTPDALKNHVVSSSTSVTTLTLTESQRSPEFYKDITWTVKEAKLALTNDPIVGYTTKMPFTRLAGLQYRMCMAGECAIGALYTEALRWRFNVDVAFIPSGGVRGPGWESGPVRVSDVWASLPFSNFACGGKIMGLRLWELLNTSYGFATFEEEWTAFGDRLLQVAGIRLRYAKHLPAFRLVSVEVMNRTTGQYQPLERTKIYTWISDTFTCNAFTPFNEILQRVHYTGEVAMNTSDNNLQAYVGQYLSAIAPTPDKIYDTALKGRMVCVDCDVNENSTADIAASNERWSSESMDLVQIQASCDVDTKWEEAIETCVPCPEGEHQPQRAQPACIPIITDDSSGALPLAAQISIPVVVVLLICAVFWGVKNELIKRRNLRNVVHAPTEGQVALVFTDIQSSTKLWGLCPRSMSAALDTHHTCIRACIAKHNAYEVKTVGDSFMIAMKSPASAMALALDLQQDLYNQQYPASINDVYKIADKHVHIDGSVSGSYGEDVEGDEEDLIKIEDDPQVLATFPPSAGAALSPLSPVSPANGNNPLNGGSSTRKSVDEGDPQHNQHHARSMTPDKPAPVMGQSIEEHGGTNKIGLPLVPSALAINDGEDISAAALPTPSRIRRKSKLRDPTVWNGLRVRIGVHVGNPEIVMDSVSKGYDYYGPDVNVAARVESIGAGGQTCVTEAALDALDSAEQSQLEQVADVKSLGTVHLAGVPYPTKIFQVLPMSLKSRLFPKIKDESDHIHNPSGDSETNSVHALGDQLSGSTRDALNSSISSESNSPTDATISMVRRTLKKLTLTAQPKERRAILAAIVKPWRITSIPLEDEDRIMNVLSKRISMILRREEYRARFVGSIRSRDAEIASIEDSVIGVNSIGGLGSLAAQAAGGGGRSQTSHGDSGFAFKPATQILDLSNYTGALSAVSTGASSPRAQPSSSTPATAHEAIDEVVVAVNGGGKGNSNNDSTTTNDNNTAVPLDTTVEDI